jgi:8-oxo-dGTP pyrophosphatase MutT (NUDIX family)
VGRTHFRTDQPVFHETDFAALRAGIAANMAAFSPTPAAAVGLKRAAVAIAITADERGAPAFFLTKRAPRLNAHSGQWALPGGRLDPGEDAVTAALREMDEEIGVRVSPADVLGLLDDYPTRSGYCITPVVVWAGPEAKGVPNPDEVARLHHIPLADLAPDEVIELAAIPDSEHPLVRVHIAESHVHAPTAALIYQFREVALAGRATMVAHLQQPKWAWK